jgi:hypothetical protein
MIRTLIRLVRPAVLVGVFGALLALGVNQTAWATSADLPRGATVPTPTPGGPSVPTATAVPAQTGGCSTTVADPNAPVPPGAVRGVVDPNCETTVPVGGATVRVPRGGATTPGTIEAQPEQGILNPNPGFVFTQPQVRIVLYDENGQPISNATFGQPGRVCFTYGAAEMAAAGGNASNLLLQYYDESLNPPAWVNLPLDASAPAGQVCANLTRPGLVTLAIRSTAVVPAALPRTAGEGSANATWLTLAILCVGALGLTLRHYARSV